MPIDKTVMERLVFLKSLHQEAIQQSHRQMPLASVSVLTFHDAIELFLYLAAEEVDTKADSNILQCLNNIEQKTGQDLHGYSGIKRLKEARVGLKHFANRPDYRDIESYRIIVDSFFEENTPKIFGFEYSEVKLAQLVMFDEAREFILEAENLADQNEWDKAMGHLAYAHDRLISEYRDRSMFNLDYSPYPIFSVRRGFNDRQSDELQDVFNDISDVLLYVSLGIDYSRYSRFKYLTPSLTGNHDPNNAFGKYQPFLDNYSYDEFPVGSYDFCLDFIIELALSLQNLDFDFDNEPTPSTSSALDW